MGIVNGATNVEKATPEFKTASQLVDQVKLAIHKQEVERSSLPSRVGQVARRDDPKPTGIRVKADWGRGLDKKPRKRSKPRKKRSKKAKKSGKAAAKAKTEPKTALQNHTSDRPKKCDSS